MRPSPSAELSVCWLDVSLSEAGSDETELAPKDVSRLEPAALSAVISVVGR